MRDAFKTDAERNAITTAACKKKAEETTGDRGQYGQLLFKYPALRDLMSVRGQINERAFGWRLSNARDNIRDGWQLRRYPQPGKARMFYLVGPESSAEVPAAPEAPLPTVEPDDAPF